MHVCLIKLAPLAIGSNRLAQQTRLSHKLQSLSQLLIKNTKLAFDSDNFAILCDRKLQNKPDGVKNQDCIFELLQLRSSYDSCQQIPIQISQNIIQQIDGSNYIGVFPNNTKLQMICGCTDFTTIKENFLITVPHGS
ncbi:hypothetical protein NQ315_015374 [Exocentrus adspersus]|uniref:Uncharacterized protein n=1 Tax=Exocentrus adspersus TaxID=1586481 RepID=A0AAV8VLH4_9CUCU|nr:hypothetical protein NQ315_015374 [Exocentrus adspersus]